MIEEQGNRPKLSDSLEEAARLYAIPHYMKDIDVHHIEEYPYDTGLEAAFIAGAEWQAKQGYSLEYIIQYAWGVSDTSTESKKATLSFPLPEDIFEGDKVVIQIRKK